MSATVTRRFGIPLPVIPLPLKGCSVRDRCGSGIRPFVGLAGLRRASFTGRVPFEFKANPGDRSHAHDGLTVGGRQVPLVFVRNPRARRYVLRLRADGSARVTIPRGGSATEAGRFLARNLGWLERQLQRRAARPLRPKEWSIGTEILLRGEPVMIEAGINGESGMIRVGSETIRVPDHAADLRRAIESHLSVTGCEGVAPKSFRICGDAPVARAPRHGAQPANALGIVLASGNGVIELATHPNATAGPGLHHPP